MLALGTPCVHPRAPSPVEGVRAALQTSDVVRAAASVRQDGGRSLALGGAPVRPLRPEEVARLEALGNFCPDWSRVRVAEDFDCGAVRHSTFHGDVLLGRFAGSVRVAGGLTLPAGVYHSTLADCVVGPDALIQHVRLLANYVIGAGAVLFDCGSVTCDAPTSFGNGLALPLGVETGGRDVPAYAELDVATAAAVARARHLPDLLRRYVAAVAAYEAEARSPRGVVGPGAVVRHTPQVRNTYVGPHAQVDGATLVADSTLLGDPEEPARVESGACVTGSLLQWGSRVGTLAVVERAVLGEHAHVERHAKVTASLVGPNSSVGCGEVTSCLVGPFVNAHHQSLLIAALWPEGKGNVSSGANVGSNHTSKAPDQEFLPGEGLFVGLGVNVKYPADFSRSPYTILACGVTTLPQRVAFPFSLVNLPSEHWPDVPPAYNELIPAWLLTDNLYAVKRCEGKYRARNKARRARLEFETLRPAVVDLLRDAVRRLERVSERREVYTERDVEGLGKNYLREEHRVAAIAGYRFFIRHYALLGLMRRVEQLVKAGQVHALADLLTAPSQDSPWEHQRGILAEERGQPGVAALLKALQPMLEQVARAVEKSKAKDDERGRRIIGDYAEVHVPADQDPFVRQTWQETWALQAEVEQLLARLAEATPPAGDGRYGAAPLEFGRLVG
jgi:hypothetical protein